MAIFTNGVFPSGGEAGDGGGVIQVTHGSRSGPVYYYRIGSTTYICACYADITPRKNTNKILIQAHLNGLAHRGGNSGEFEGWVGYNATAPNGTTVTAFDQACASWTNLAPITGLGTWNTSQHSYGSETAICLHSPNTTNICRYLIILGRRSDIYFNNEWNTNPDAGGSDQGTTLTLMEVSS